MELGQKLRRARLDAGLSQRELCAGEITRNMLSQIENGTASPSMKTLGYLAQRLGRPVSYFLEEAAVVSDNLEVMAQARRAFDEGDWAQAVEALAAFSGPDGIFQRERDLLWTLCHLNLAEEALMQEKLPYAKALLKETVQPLAYCGQELARRRLLLLGRMGEAVTLPPVDEELLVHGREALRQGDARRCGQLLDAVQDQEESGWNLMRGEAFLAQRQYREAAQCFHRAEAAFPQETASKLERCYRELEDFRLAYFYACKGR